MDFRANRLFFYLSSARFLPLSDLFTNVFPLQYLRLGKNAADRRQSCRTFLSHHVDGELLKEIRDNTRKGMAVEDDRFKEEIEAMTGRRMKSKERGRRVGWGERRTTGASTRKGTIGQRSF